jgi:hypothetical protein
MRLSHTPFEFMSASATALKHNNQCMGTAHAMGKAGNVDPPKNGTHTPRVLSNT